MLKQKRKLNNFIKYIVIPGFLVIFWLFSYLMFNDHVSFSVLQKPHNFDSFGNLTSGKLLANHDIGGEITAGENNLGILYIRFSQFTADYQKTESLFFKIKEKGSKDWYFTNSYRIGYLEKLGYFPFGFPTIVNSKGKSYIFEVGSSTENKRNLVQISSKNPVIYSAYQFPKSTLLSSKKELPEYLFKKIYNSLTRFDLIAFSLVYAIPLFTYLLWLIFSDRFKLKTQIAFLSFFAVIYLDVVFVGYFNQIVLGVIVAGWVMSIKVLRLNKNMSYYMSLALILMWLLIVYFGVTKYSDQLSIWTYTFLITGLGWNLLDYLRSNEKV